MKNVNRTALVVGVSKYDVHSGYSILKNSVNDADKMGEALERIGFEVLPVIDPYRDEFLQVIKEFKEKLLFKKGQALFYFSGHGNQYNQKNYLIPRGLKSADADDLPDYAISLDRILDVFRYTQTEMNIVLLDACRTNALGTGTRGASKGLAAIPKDSQPNATLLSRA